MYKYIFPAGYILQSVEFGEAYLKYVMYRSERIHKTNISGVTLNEAKHINLSLHYLEQVIKALSQTNRQHIPFRNSMMTYMLRDSLSGNSLTAMLTTLSTSLDNIEVYILLSMR